MAEPQKKQSTALLVISWLWVGLPAAWGVSQTVTKSMALFSPPEAAKPTAPAGGPAAAPSSSPASGATPGVPGAPASK